MAALAIAELAHAQCDDAACANVKKSGADPGDRFGWCVCGAGRINSGGQEDIAVGAYRDDVSGSNSGRAFVYKGPDLGTLYALNGAEPGDNFGRAVASVGDVDDDNRDDLVIGAPYNDDNGGNAGRIYVYSGRDHDRLWSRKGFDAGDFFGWAVAGAGDVDNDGVDDVIVGAPRNDANGEDAGRAYVFSGDDGVKIWTVTGSAAGDRFGSSVVGLGDLDDDGHADFAVAAPLNDDGGENAGRVYIYSGINKQLIQELPPEAPGVQFGTSMAATEYIEDGNVYSLLIVGIPHDSQGGEAAGHIHIYARNHDQPFCPDWICQIHIANGLSPGDHLGRSVAIGQVFGNAVPDFIVGAPLSDAGGEDSGQVNIFSVGSINSFCCTTIPMEHSIAGQSAGDQFGYSVATADLNNDGVDDIIVGAPLNDIGGTDSGRVYVFYGE